MIIGFTGRKQVGKDTAADIITATYGHLGYTKSGFADKLKEVCVLLFGCKKEELCGTNEDKNKLTGVKWDDIKGVTYESKRSPIFLTNRELLQVVGTDMCRRVYDNLWIHSVFKEGDKHLVFIDVRFQNEAKAIKDRGGLIIKIERGFAPNKIEHVSEQPLPDELIDLTIVNNGTREELRNELLGYMAPKIEEALDAH